MFLVILALSQTNLYKMNILLIALSILPVILLMIFIYKQDKYQKEPIKSLIKAFIGGMIAIPIDLLSVSILNIFWYSNTVFYSAFLEAGFCEECSKLIIFLIFIWRDKNFDEYMDGIVYATFIGLGFACVENFMYVFDAAGESFGSGIGTGIVRALLSVPGHFLFGVVLGYFLSMAKFSKSKGQGSRYIITGLLLAAGCHGLFDWLLMVSDLLTPTLGIILSIAFLVGDFFLWKLGVKLIRRQQENSRIQGENAQNQDKSSDDDTDFNSGSNTISQDTDYKQIDWNAGFKQ